MCRIILFKFGPDQFRFVLYKGSANYQIVGDVRLQPFLTCIHLIFMKFGRDFYLLGRSFPYIFIVRFGNLILQANQSENNYMLGCTMNYFKMEYRLLLYRGGLGYKEVDHVLL